MSRPVIEMPLPVPTVRSMNPKDAPTGYTAEQMIEHREAYAAAVLGAASEPGGCVYDWAVKSIIEARGEVKLLATAQPTVDWSGLRALRLWHWQGVSYNRARAADCRSAPTMRAQFVESAEWYDKQADFHLRQVQELNVFFAPGDTAERDAEVAK